MLTHTVSVAAVVVVEAALIAGVVGDGVDVETGAEGVSDAREPVPSGTPGTDDGASPPVGVDSAVFAAGGAVVVADARRGCALSTKTAIPATAMIAAMVTTKNGRDGRAGMRLLVQARSIRQCAQQLALCRRNRRDNDRGARAQLACDYFIPERMRVALELESRRHQWRITFIRSLSGRGFFANPPS
jgi:hypothetical protein